MSKPLVLTLQDIKDKYVRKNFEALKAYLTALTPTTGIPGFKLITITFTQAETNFKHPHGLGKTPLDLIQTSKTGAGAITWNYALFDSQFLDITVTDACVVRAYVGTNQEAP